MLADIDITICRRRVAADPLLRREVEAGMSQRLARRIFISYRREETAP